MIRKIRRRDPQRKLPGLLAEACILIAAAQYLFGSELPGVFLSA